MKKKITSLVLVLVVAMSMTVGASAASYIPDDVTYEDLLAMLKECISEYKRGKCRLTTGDHPTDPVA